MSSWTLVASLVLVGLAVVIFLFTRRPMIVSPPGAPSSDTDQTPADYPGSTLIADMEASVTLGIQPRPGGQAPRVLCTDAAPDQVRNWFRDWFLAHGWKEDAVNQYLSQELSAKVATRSADQARMLAGISVDMYHRSRRLLALMILPLTDDHPLRTNAHLPAAARTVYTVTLQGR